MESRFITVSELNNTARELIENFPLFKNFYIKGEVADFKGASKNGHVYFTLKDESCSVRAVVWKGNVGRAVKNLKNGSEVIITGKVSLYNKGGYINITVYDIIEKGAGDLSQKKDEIYLKYQSLGYFNEENKKPLPKYPKDIAVITSKRGAAIGDVLRTMAMRYPICTISVIDVAVQGEEAPKQIANAIYNADSKYDLIFITRGGGSEEDLSAFDDALVVEAVFNCKTPVLSAVGHDRDRSLIDLIADKSASTPTQGAVLAVPDYLVIFDYLNQIENIMVKSVKSVFAGKEKDLIISTKRKGLTEFKNKVMKFNERVENSAKKLETGYLTSLQKKEFKLMLSIEKIEGLSPLAVLSRGYSIALKDKKPIRDASLILNSDDVYVKLFKGGFTAKVLEVDYE